MRPLSWAIAWTTALLAAVVVGGCAGGGGDGAAIPKEKLPSLVLRPGDLPPVFIQFDRGRLLVSDLPSRGPRSDHGRFGRIDGWKARYRRPGSQETAGPLVIVSHVDLFEDENGAEKDFAAYAEDFEQAMADSRGTAKRIQVPSIGEETVALTLRQAAGATAVSFFFVAWRHENATARLEVNGFEGSVTLDDAVALARKQQRRIVQAAD